MTEEPIPQRKIIHIDMDAFFASVEQRDKPELRGRPVAVGSPAARGVVAAASYEARQFGVHSAMASLVAARKCPDLIFVPPRFEVYRAISAQIREIFAEHTDQIEPLSLDEAYLDVTTNRQAIPVATEIANAIRARILEETGLTASAGVSYNKFLAKMASGQNKPNGICVISPARGPEFMKNLKIAKFHGVGPVTAGRMKIAGIETGADLAALTLPRPKYAATAQRPIPAVQAAISNSRKRSVRSGPGNVENGVGCGQTTFYNRATITDAIAYALPSPLRGMTHNLIDWTT